MRKQAIDYRFSVSICTPEQFGPSYECIDNYKCYGSEGDVPADAARRDYMEFVVEKILKHSGDTEKPTAMSFHVKWLNYDDSHNSWKPWKNLRLCEALHDYLRDNKMEHFISKNLEASVSED